MVSTYLKNMLVKMGSSSPNFGVNIKKYLSCHHLEDDVFFLSKRGPFSAKYRIHEILPTHTMHCYSREIPQNCHRFVLFDSPKMGNLMTLVLSCWLFQSIWPFFFALQMGSFPQVEVEMMNLFQNDHLAIIVGKKQIHPSKLTWMEPNRGGFVQIMFRLKKNG